MKARHSTPSPENHPELEQLRQQVQDLNRQLLQAERLRSLGTLSGGVAHHFNNLLSVILGYTSFVLNRDECTAESAEALRHIAEAAQRGRRLTEEILAFSGDDLDEEQTLCEVHDILGSVFSLLQSQTPSNIRMDLNLEAPRDAVYAHSSAIHQVVFNLLTQALDSMPEGGTMTVATDQTDIPGDEERRPYLRIAVTDSAGSLPADLSDRQPGDEDQAMGIKLSSVYGMVSRLDGTVMVSSQPGEHTRVEVLLPLLRPADETVDIPPKPRRLSASTIWVVDDDPLFRQMCRQVLSDEGHQVEECDDGAQLMTRWQAEDTHPDLLVIDFSMPEYNGLELAQWLREQGAQAPLILVSGFAANQPDIRKALALRKTFFLQKPFSIPELSDAVTVALGETLIG